MKTFIKNLIINILTDDKVRQTTPDSPKYAPIFQPKRLRRLVISEDEDGNLTYMRTDPDLPAPFSVSPGAGFSRQMETAAQDLFAFLVSDDMKKVCAEAMRGAVKDWARRFEEEQQNNIDKR